MNCFDLCIGCDVIASIFVNCKIDSYTFDLFDTELGPAHDDHIKIVTSLAGTDLCWH